MDGMKGMGAMSSPPPSSSSTDMHGHKRKKMMMMHMTFFWSDKTEILFSGWPGTRPGMYTIALISVFVLAFVVELLSHTRLVNDGGSGSVAAGLLRTLVHALRVGLAYLVMLAVMSFNGGVFLAAVAGHTFGFLLFGSKIFRSKSSSLLSEKTSNDLRFSSTTV